VQVLRSKFEHFRSEFRVLAALVKGRSDIGDQAEQLDSFYAPQAAEYDRFRQRLLPGRSQLMANIPLPKEGVWIDFGGGTGSNLELVQDKLPELKKIYVVDLARSLLKVCDQRIEKHHWPNVRTVFCDAQKFEPDEGQADVITFSYSLTMMPSWQEVVSNAFRLLKPGGWLGMVDFYLPSPPNQTAMISRSRIKRQFLKRWFAHDKIWLGSERIEFIREKFIMNTLFESSAHLPWLPIIKVPWCYLIAQKPN
jgi:S-adenosylmethionine-diacylgycerolhomoserine-N-methlytransferase